MNMQGKDNNSKPTLDKLLRECGYVQIQRHRRFCCKRLNWNNLAEKLALSLYRQLAVVVETDKARCNFNMA